MSKGKIILCYPPLNESPSERGYHWFPFSVLPLAQLLSDNDYQPIVIDFRVESDPQKKLLMHLKGAILVGISSMSGYQINGGLKIAELVRKNNSDLKIIWGGWHSTILPEETAEDSLVDIAVTGRGAKTIVEIAEVIRSEKEFQKIKGIAYKKDKKIIFTGYKTPTKLIDDAQEYQKYIKIKSYINPNTMWLGYFSGHGCSQRCAFCSRHFMTNKYSANPVAKVIDDIKYFVKNYGFKHVHFQDDNFFLDINRALEIASELISSKLKITWWTNCRADVIPKLDNSELNLLSKSGLNSIFVGAESASQELLNMMKKDIKSNDILETNIILKDYDIFLNLSYMFGVPGDNLNKLNMTINQIAKLKIENKKINIQTCFYQPFPETSLYETALKWGYPRLKRLKDWGLIKPQTYLSKIPWLSYKEMKQYEKKFYDFFGRE